MKIAVIGAGYVGLVSAACFAELGHSVVVVDNDSKKIRGLREGHVPIHEIFLPELISKHGGKNLLFSDDIQAASSASDAVFVCVGTPPSSSGDADLSYVEGVARELALSLDRPKVIVEKSTVPVGTCDAVRRTMMLNGADEEYLSIASNPEFLREGTAVTDFLYPDRILLGVGDDHSREVLTAIYQPLLDGSYYQRAEKIPSLSGDETAHVVKLIVSSVKSAELIKHASNAFLALKISFINAVSNVCERVNADVREVAAGMGADSRIGPRFLQPGIGYGGSCFPKDVLAFRAVAKSVGYDFALLTEVIAVNDQQKVRFIARVREALWTLRGKRLAVLGLAFKGGTDDIRDSPAIDIIYELLDGGATITAYDPAAMSKAKNLLTQDRVTFASSAYEACAGADAVLILTEWPEFASLDWNRVRGLLTLPILIDGKNLVDPIQIASAGLSYFGVGCRAPRAQPARQPQQMKPSDAAIPLLAEISA